MRCNKCKSQNDRNANFCESCGSPLKKPRSGKSKINHAVKKQNFSKSEPRFALLNYLMSYKQIWVFMSIFLTILIVVIAINSKNDLSSRNDSFKDIASINPIIEAKVFEIASKFVCGCGSCNEESLDICKCNYAVEERKFIRDYLEQNSNSADIITAVVNKYGGLKPDASFVNDDQKVILPSTISSNDMTNIASYSDRENIYTFFNCPCGQCGIDELKDCNCNHKNGAKEVKKFIDMKLSERQFSVSQIVGLVDTKYGGKK
jgi:hypothetical protein